MRAAKYVGMAFVAMALVMTGGCDEEVDDLDSEFVEPLPNEVIVSEGENGEQLVTFRLVEDNGRTFNGRTWNGRTWNGNVWNGPVWNGLQWTGLKWNSDVFNVESANLRFVNGKLQANDPSENTRTMGPGDHVTSTVTDTADNEEMEIEMSEHEAVPGRPHLKFVRLRYKNEEGNWIDACQDGGGNPVKAILLPRGYDDSAKRRRNPPPVLNTWACRAAALAKCVEWGYFPEDEYNGTPLHEFHEVCTMVVRANYNDDGEHHTTNGTPIDVQDAAGVQVHETAWPIEAVWGLNGAICLNNPRKLAYTHASVEAERGEAIPWCNTQPDSYWYNHPDMYFITRNTPS